MSTQQLAEIYEQHSQRLLALAATVAGPSSADDIVSEAILSILAGSREYANPTGVMYSAVVASAKKHWRTLDRRSKREALAVRQTPLPIASLQPADPDDQIVAALLRLSPQQRAVVHLRYWEDLTAPSIAQRLGVSDGTVRRQLARANHRLEKMIGE